MPYNINEETNESEIEFDFIEEYPINEPDVKNVINDTTSFTILNTEAEVNEDG
ncbi:MAG: hypothetical protein ACK521_04565 [bacterium]